MLNSAHLLTAIAQLLIIPVLRDVLGWLPMPQRTLFKVSDAIDCVCGSDPSYFKDVCVLVTDRSGQAQLGAATYLSHGHTLSSVNQSSEMLCHLTCALLRSVKLNSERG